MLFLSSVFCLNSICQPKQLLDTVINFFSLSLCIIQKFRCVGKTETKSNQPIFNLYFVQLSIKSFIHLFNIPYFIDFFAASFAIYITNASINFNWNNGKLCIFATKFAQIDIQWNAKRFFHSRWWPDGFSLLLLLFGFRIEPNRKYYGKNRFGGSSTEHRISLTLIFHYNNNEMPIDSVRKNEICNCEP